MGISRLTKHRINRQDRRGAATVEFAICAVVFFLFVFAIVEFSRFVFVQHSVRLAAYEAARAGVVPGANHEIISKRANQLLGACGISNASVAIDPPLISSATEEITVTITCNFAQNSWLPPTFFVGRAITSNVTLEHENKAFLTSSDIDIKTLIGNNDSEPLDR